MAVRIKTVIYHCKLKYILCSESRSLLTGIDGPNLFTA